jgi:hypothetical protein
MTDIDSLRDDMRKREPNKLARVVLCREIEGHQLSLEVAPCSWMYPLYGLQVQITLHGEGGNVHLHDKAVLFENATEADLNRLFDAVKIIPCKRCGKPAFDPVVVDTNRNGFCEHCFMDDLNADFNKAQEKHKKETQRLDAKHKAEGYSHRIDAWIHAGGDDQQIAFYSKGEPSPEEIRALIRKKGSRKDDDFQIITL